MLGTLLCIALGIRSGSRETISRSVALSIARVAGVRAGEKKNIPPICSRT